MGKLSRDEEAWVVEPNPVPLIPVSRVVAVTLLPGGQVCVTLAQDVPDSTGRIESVVQVKLLWQDGEAGKAANRKIAELLADERRAAGSGGGLERRAH